MKLIAKAKPVKIRIKSGEEDHTSLDSLKRNLNISEIQPLLDGRLVRWLKQQEKNELADFMENFNASKLETLQGIMDFIEPLFHEYLEENSINNTLSLLEFWLKSSIYRKNGEHLFYYIIGKFCFCDEGDKYLEIAKYLYKNKDNLNCPRYDWYLLFVLYQKEDENKSDPDILYFLGNMLWEGYQFYDRYINDHFEGDEEGLRLIKEAARLGNQDANLFIFNYNLNQEKKKVTGRFSEVDQDKLKRWISLNWKEDSGIPEINFTWDFYDNNSNDTLKFNVKDYSNDKEKYILNFICQCNYLISTCANQTWESSLKKAMLFFFPKGEKNCDDILKKEKWFIIGLLKRLKGDGYAATEKFREADDYPPAKYMLKSDKLINNINLKEMPFPAQISFVIKHLFDYE